MSHELSGQPKGWFMLYLKCDVLCPHLGCFSLTVKGRLSVNLHRDDYLKDSFVVISKSVDVANTCHLLLASA